MIAVGRLRKRVEIQSNTPTTGDFGGERPSWSTVATVWGGFRHDLQQSREQEDGPQQQAMTLTVITLRYWPGLTTLHRLKLGARTFNIDRLGDVDEKNRQVLAYCKQVA